MDNRYKERLIGSGLLKKVPSKSNIYRANCPYCMDRKYHLYLRIDLDTDEPVLYDCKRCPQVHGVLNQKLLMDMGFDEGAIKIPRDVGKTMKKLKTDECISATMNIITVNDEDDIRSGCEYINERVGHVPTIDELRMFQFIGNPERYVKDYLGDKNISMLKDRNWFKMTNGNIVGRIKDDKLSDIHWLQYITQRVKNTGIYQMKTPVDMYQPINVIIAEGIMDVIGLYYNYGELNNTMYEAVMSKHYNRGMEHIMNKGIFGMNVHLHIFKDSNVPCESIWLDPIRRQLFGKVYIYENVKDKDYGITPDRLRVRRIEKR